MKQERESTDDGPPRGPQGVGLTADGERARPHPEGWVHFLRECCAGCDAAAGRARERMIH
jgi:hypothetical protein